ncbi:MAG TPA: NUDIX hydrolase [Methylococcales bacterium]
MLDSYGRVMLLHRSSPDISYWELPGVRVEPGEVAEQAVVEKIDENLGIEIRLVKALGFDDYEEGDDEYHCTWFQAVAVNADPALRNTQEFDDLEYFEIEDLASLALSVDMQLLYGKIISGGVELDT